MEKVRYFQSLAEAAKFLGGLSQQNFADLLANPKDSSLIVGVGDQRIRFSSRCLKQLEELYGERKEVREELMGLRSFAVNMQDYPEIDRLLLVRELLADEERQVPAMISSFHTGLTYDTNVLTHIPSGLEPEIVRQICNISYFPGDQYEMYAKRVLKERGGWIEQQYIARKASTGELMRYTTRARAIRIKGLNGLYRYAQTVEAPEPLE